MMRHAIRSAAAGVLSLALVVPASAQTTIDTWTGWQAGTTGGKVTMAAGGAFNTYMQLITVPTDNILTSWTLFLNSASVPSDFRVAITEWDGANGAATLPVSFVNGIFSTPLGGSPQPVQVFSGALALTPGIQYAFLVGAVGVAQAAGASAQLAWRRDDPYGEGHGARMSATGTGHVFAVAPPWEAGTQNRWQHFPDYDLAMVVDFAGPQQVVPEPITIILLGTGLACVAAVRRRKQQLQATRQ
jgi:hypothetical protein